MGGGGGGRVGEGGARRGAPVHRGQSFCHVARVLEGQEREAAEPARVAIRRQVHVEHLPVLAELGPQLRLVRLRRRVRFRQTERFRRGVDSREKKNGASSRDRRSVPADRGGPPAPRNIFETRSANVVADVADVELPLVVVAAGWRVAPGPTRGAPAPLAPVRRVVAHPRRAPVLSQLLRTAHPRSSCAPARGYGRHGQGPPNIAIGIPPTID